MSKPNNYVYCHPTEGWVKVRRHAASWSNDYTYTSEYVNEIKEATVLGIGGDTEVSDYRNVNLKSLLKKLSKECIQMEAKLIVERSVELVKPKLEEK